MESLSKNGGYRSQGQNDWLRVSWKFSQGIWRLSWAFAGWGGIFKSRRKLRKEHSRQRGENMQRQEVIKWSRIPGVQWEVRMRAEWEWKRRVWGSALSAPFPETFKANSSSSNKRFFHWLAVWNNTRYLNRGPQKCAEFNTCWCPPNTPVIFICLCVCPYHESQTQKASGPEGNIKISRKPCLKCLMASVTHLSWEGTYTPPETGPIQEGSPAQSHLPIFHEKLQVHISK